MATIWIMSSLKKCGNMRNCLGSPKPSSSSSEAVLESESVLDSESSEDSSEEFSDTTAAALLGCAIPAGALLLGGALSARAAPPAPLPGAFLGLPLPLLWGRPSRSGAGPHSGKSSRHHQLTFNSFRLSKGSCYQLSLAKLRAVFMDG